MQIKNYKMVNMKKYLKEMETSEDFQEVSLEKWYIILLK